MRRLATWTAEWLERAAGHPGDRSRSTQHPVGAVLLAWDPAPARRAARELANHLESIAPHARRVLVDNRGTGMEWAEEENFELVSGDNSAREFSGSPAGHRLCRGLWSPLMLDPRQRPLPGIPGVPFAPRRWWHPGRRRGDRRARRPDQRVSHTFEGVRTHNRFMGVLELPRGRRQVARTTRRSRHGRDGGAAVSCRIPRWPKGRFCRQVDLSTKLRSPTSPSGSPASE